MTKNFFKNRIKKLEKELQLSANTEFYTDVLFEKFKNSDDKNFNKTCDILASTYENKFKFPGLSDFIKVYKSIIYPPKNLNLRKKKLTNREVEQVGNIASELAKKFSKKGS